MKRFKPYVYLSILLCSILILFFINREDFLLTPSNSVEKLQTWNYQSETITLPTRVNVDANEVVHISTILDAKFHDPKTLLIRTSLQDVRIYLDNNLIYEKVFRTHQFDPYASLWHFVELPHHVEGQTLTIEVSSPYESIAGQLNPVLFGTTDALYIQLYRSYGVRFIVSILVLVLGLIIVIVNTFVTKNHDKGFVYAGIFMVLLSLWLIAESRLLQFFTGSQILIASLAYIMIPLLPLPLIKYLKEVLITGFGKLLTTMYLTFFGIFVTIVFLNTFHIVDFFDTVIYTQAAVLIGMVIGLFLIIIEIVKYKNKKAVNFLLVIIFIVIFAVIEIVSFVNNDFMNTSSYLSVGVGIILIGYFVYYVRHVLTIFKVSYQKEFYEKLAYMDHVTQGFNRLSFERDLDEIFKDYDRKNKLRLIVFDLDELKNINDNHGHLVGDDAIRLAFKIANDAFSDVGKCYRIGGDEFACLYEDNDMLTYQIKKQLIDEAIKKEQAHLSFHFGFSIGTAIVKSLNMTQEELMKEADSNMYHNKKHFKMVFK